MILGTAGHVDHGKTSLVKALTGIDTDRLPEEKRRGITLELGFAHLDLPDGRRLGVVDVPGHERFVRAMAAGAGGVDLALLVVAADEGVMPQTREHVDICALLGVRAGVLVVSKADLLPGLGDGWLELLTQDLRALCTGTFLEGAAVVPVSAKTSEGLDALKSEIARVASALPVRPSEGPAFLPIDRAFTSKGFGTIVTGTLLSGTLEKDEALSVLPGLEGPLRARGLQVHGQARDRVVAGERVAVNLTGVETDALSRGMAVARHGELTAPRVLDVELTLLPSAPEPLGRRTRLLLSIGTAHAEVQVRLIDVTSLRPGEKCFAQLRAEAPFPAVAGQPFILRGSKVVEGRGATVAGGRVLAIDPPRRRKGAGEKLKALAESDAGGRVLWLLREAGYPGLTEKELFARAGLGPKELAKLLEACAAKGSALLVDKEARRFLASTVFEGLRARALALVEAFHAAQPEADGMPREELRQKLGLAHEKTFARLVAALVEAKKLELVGEKVRAFGRARAFDSKGAGDKERLLALLSKAALEPPLPAELARSLGIPDARLAELLKVAVQDGAAVRAGELWFDAAAVKALAAKVAGWLEQDGELTTQRFKERTGLSRKFMIPLLEYFDREKLTLRVGDKRVARKR
jgi:selenocysteine-specific elongation factor